MKFIIAFALFAVACAAKIETPKNAEIPIVRSSSDSDVDGSYKYGYETGNGIIAGAVGNTDGVKGKFSYTSPEGEKFELTYVADENGYQPKGKHLPVGPEVPAYIIRALEYSRTHPWKEEV